VRLISEQNDRYRVEDIFTHTDHKSFSKYFFFYPNYYLTLSKTIKKTEPDKHIFFSKIQLLQEQDIITTDENRSNSYSTIFPFYFTCFSYFDNSTLPCSIPSQSSTIEEDTASTENQIRSLFEFAKDEFFEDGMETAFSKNLETIILKHGISSIVALSKIVFDKQSNEEIVSEALRLLGRIQDQNTYNIRLWLLEQNLKSNSARIRDGALLGLASLDDPHSIPSMKKAIQAETYLELREDMQQVLKQLETLLPCH
jgi:hypothetical protein